MSRKSQETSCKKTDLSDGSDKSDKLKFTPGPWHILVPKPRYGNRECHSIVDGGGEYVAKTVVVSVLRGISSVKREERKANEHLIAAAPEMYDALKEVCENCDKLSNWEDLFNIGRPDGTIMPKCPCKDCSVDKVLKKVRGEK